MRMAAALDAVNIHNDALYGIVISSSSLLKTNVLEEEGSKL